MKAICPTCGIGVLLIIRNEKVHAIYSFDDDSRKYRATIANCANPDCNELILLWQEISFVEVQKSDRFDGDIHFWTEEEIKVLSQQIVLPKPLDPAHRIVLDIPEPYKSDFIETCAVLPVSPRASAALSRRLLQNILHGHFKIKLKTLAEEIDAFIKNTTASSYLKDDMHFVRHLGNIAVHPAESKSTGTILDIEPNEAEGLIAVIKVLLDFAFVEPKRAEERQKIFKAKKDDAK